MTNTTKTLIVGAAAFGGAKFGLSADLQKAAIFAGAAMAVFLILAEFTPSTA